MKLLPYRTNGIWLSCQIWTPFAKEALAREAQTAFWFGIGEMKLEEYIQQFSLDEVLAIEYSDKQFIVLQSARNHINSQKDTDKELFVFLILQCALVWFQIAGSGPLWREEFAQKIEKDWIILQELQYNNVDRWYDFLITSRYNKRLYNNKRKRLEKFVMVYNDLVQYVSLLDHHNNMFAFRNNLSDAMKQHPHNKTMAFAIKMYGYGARIVTKNFISYPMDIVIPLDSRLRKIYTEQYSDTNSTDHEIVTYYQQLAKTNNIAPLHLDSLIWIDYREKYG